MLLHCDYGNLPIEWVAAIQLSARWAVPFFFITSGYFLGLKIHTLGAFDFQKIQKNIVLLISILIVASFVYLPVILSRNYFPNNVSVLLIGTFPHLWFIGSLILGYIFIWYICFIGKNKLLPILSISILLFVLFTSSYDDFLGVSLGHNLSRFLISIPFMYVGMWLSQPNIKMLPLSFWVFIAALGFILQYLEVFAFFKLFDHEVKDHEFLLGNIIMSPALFIIAKSLMLKENIFTIGGRKYSLLIYLYHPFVYIVLGGLISLLFQESYIGKIEMFNPLLGFILILTIALFLDKYLNSIFRVLNGNISSPVKDYNS